MRQLSSSEEKETSCLYCNGFYSESVEGWINCQSCGYWAHCSCANVDDDENATYVCPHCHFDK